MAYELFDLVEATAEGPAAAKRVLWAPDGTRTWAELRDRAASLAVGLHDLGVGEGTAVGIMMGNRIEHLESIFAIAALGGVVVPVNVLFRGDEADHLLRDSDVSVLLVDEHAHRAIDAVRGSLNHVVRVGDAHDGELSYEDILADPSALARPTPDADRVLVHYYTSGTTGRPKAAVHTHRTLLGNATQQALDLPLDSTDVFLVVSSLTWAAGFNSVTLATLVAGGGLALLPTGGITTDSVIDHIEASGATSTVIAPTMLRRISLDPPAMSRLEASTLRTVFSGGEPLTADVVIVLGDAVPSVGFCQAYGLSEFPTIASTLLPHEAVTRAGTAGRATTGTRLAVRCDNGAIGATGTGELLIRSASTMVRYHDQPEQTASAFADGWLNTGDLVEIDDDGYVTVKGRTKDMIISGALNIYPAEIERVISTIDDVAEACVVGMPDPEWGERVVAVVVATSAAVTVDAVLGLCREQLATYKVPREVVITASALPRTVSGKLSKPDVKDLLSPGQDVARALST